MNTCSVNREAALVTSYWLVTCRIIFSLLVVEWQICSDIKFPDLFIWRCFEMEMFWRCVKSVAQMLGFVQLILEVQKTERTEIYKNNWTIYAIITKNHFIVSTRSAK